MSFIPSMRVKTAIASGLFHFLPDTAARMVFDELASAGFHTLIFNHANPGINNEAVIPENWKVELAAPLREIMIQDTRFGTRFAGMSGLHDFYKCVRV